MTEQAITLLSYRNALNLSRKDMAEITGLTQARIWKLEQIETPAPEKDVADYTLVWDALQSYEVENPEGKPKPAKKTTAPKNDHILEDLKLLVSKVDIAITELKAKKAGTSHLQQIKIELENLITKNS